MARARFVALALAILAPTSATATVRVQYLMGTVLRITVPGEDRARALKCMSEAFAEVSRLEDVMSTYRQTSELSRLNRSAPGVFRCSDDLFFVLDAAAGYAKATGGAFTPTLHPLILASRKSEEAGVALPEADRLRAHGLSGIEQLELDRGGRTARLRTAGAGVNLGGIGKGYALDRAGEILRGLGISSALLDFGGQILAIGAPPHAESWRVEVAGGSSSIALIDASVSTSAPVRRSQSGAGPGFPHVVDPGTGLPIPRRGSVTVIAPTAIEADAVSTALLVLGPERAGEFARRHRRLKVIWNGVEGSRPGTARVPRGRDGKALQCQLSWAEDTDRAR